MVNEKRLISAEQAYEIARLHHKDFAQSIADLTSLREVLEDCDTVDAVEVEHGYWIDSYSADHMGRIVEHGIDCSVCEAVFKDNSREVVQRWKERFKVCPFCGALMDGGKRNDDSV